MTDSRTHTQSELDQALPSGDRPTPTLTVILHPERGLVGTRRPLPAMGELVLGRGHGTAMPGALDEHKVSRAHARLVCAGGSPVVEDLHSRNGTWVNGVRVERAALADGDVLGIGNVLLLFHHTRLAFEVPRHPVILGVSSAIAHMLEQVGMVAARMTNVAIIGETGTGKELVAAEIHRASGRGGRLVAVNCGGMAETLLASELFGHVRGAFTGADRERKGLIEAARGGTLFLDEVLDASPAMQVSLLRLLESGEFRPVGSDTVKQADVRHLAAAQPEIEARLSDGRFRRDLWTRLARWVIRVPALRERPEDIAPLAQHFADKHGQQRARTLSPALVAAMLRYAWPGNVRELEAFVERLLVAAGDDETLRVHDWARELLAPAPVARPTGTAPTTDTDGDDDDDAHVAAAPGRRRSKTPRPTRAVLEECLQRHDGSVRAAAASLGVARRTLYRWLDALGVDPERYRA